MTPKERVSAQLQHRETDYIPYARLSFDSDVANRLDAYYGSPEWRSRVDNEIRSVPSAEAGMGPGDVAYHRDPFGSLWRFDRLPFHQEEPGLKHPSFDGYRFPTVDEFFPDGWRDAALEAIERNLGYFVVTGFGFGLFERTWAVRGLENILMDSLAHPGFYDELTARVAELQIAIIEKLVTLPVDGIMFSDDWGDQRGVLLGPETWRRFIKPHLSRMYDIVHRAGKYALSHCCGNVADIVPDLIEIGLDALQSVQPEAMDPYELKRLYGRDITFWGGLGSQRTIPFGTPDGIRAEVARLCEVMGRGGGYILGPAKALMPETPTENAAAVVEAMLGQAGQKPI